MFDLLCWWVFEHYRAVSHVVRSVVQNIDAKDCIKAFGV